MILITPKVESEASQDIKDFLEPVIAMLRYLIANERYGCLLQLQENIECATKLMFQVS